jgi:16S rRNA (cytidine1402-2'-O)-methyltransferase
MYEENKRGTLQELADYFKSKTVKGEIVIVVAGDDTKIKRSKKNKHDDNEDESDENE